jgi:hypothetical protein
MPLIPRLRPTPLKSRFVAVLLLCALLAGCSESIEHDESAAAQRAIEFARLVLIEKQFAKGHELLSASGRRYLPVEKLAETVTRLHPQAFPTKVTALEFQPMPGEKAIWIYLVGQNPQEQFHYRFTMEGSANGEYRLLTLDNGAVAKFFSPLSQKRSLAKPISTQP